MTLLDRLLLLLTGLLAVFALVRLYQGYQRQPRRALELYMLSFAVLLVAGILLIFFGYSLLTSPWVAVVTTLIPLALATGLVWDLKPSWATGYTVYAIGGFLAVAVVYLGGLTQASKVVMPLVHGIAGLTIVLLPLWEVTQGRAPKGMVWVSLGGVLIGLGGIALAFLKAGKQFLFFSQEVVLAILAPLLLVMTLAYTLGLVQRVRAA